MGIVEGHCPNQEVGGLVMRCMASSCVSCRKKGLQGMNIMVRSLCIRSLYPR